VKDKDSTAHDFVARILASKSLSNLETRVTWLTSSSATIGVRRAYGSWASVTIFVIGEATCESENGCAMRHVDVAYRLKQLTLDKSSNSWGRAKALRDRRGQCT
jgi:hypothetical protein